MDSGGESSRPVGKNQTKEKEVDHLKKWWAVHAAWIISFVVVPLLPAAQSLVSQHPKVAMAVGGAATIIAKLTKSPSQ